MRSRQPGNGARRRNRLGWSRYIADSGCDRLHAKLDRDKLSLSRFGKEIVRIRRVEQVADARKPSNRKPTAAGRPVIITKPRSKLTGHTAIVRGLDISPDGKRLISASWDEAARLRDLQTGEMLHLLHHEPRLNDARFSRDGGRVFVAREEAVHVYDVESHQLLTPKFQHSKHVSTMDFSSDGKRLLTGCADGAMRLWNADSGMLLKTYRGHPNFAEAVLFTAGDTEVLSGSIDQTVRRFNAQSGSLQGFYPQPGSALSMCASPAGRIVYDGTNQWLSLMRVVSTSTESTAAIVHRWMFSSDGSSLEQRGTWNEDEATLSLKPIAAGTHSFGSMVYRFASADTLEMYNPILGPTRFDVRSHSVRRSETPFPAPNFAAGPAKSPPQLKLLNPLADRKTVDVTWQQSLRHAQTRREAKVEDAKWILDGRFLLMRTLDAERRVEELRFLTFEPAENSFRCLGISNGRFDRSMALDIGRWLSAISLDNDRRQSDVQRIRDPATIAQASR